MMDHELSDLAILLRERIAETENVIEQARLIIAESRRLLRRIEGSHTPNLRAP